MNCSCGCITCIPCCSSRDGSPLDDEKSGLYPEGMPSIYEKVCAPCCFGDSFQDDSLKNLGLKASSMTHVSCKFPTMENNSINGYANMLVYALSTMEPLSAYIRCGAAVGKELYPKLFLLSSLLLLFKLL